MKRPSLYSILVVFICALPRTTLAVSWLEQRSAHFVVRYQQGEDKLASFLLKRGEKTREDIERDIGTTPPQPTLIYLVPSWDALQGALPDAPPPTWCVGVAYPSQNLIILRSPRSVRGGGTDLEEVLRHEYAHLALAHALKGNHPPRWLDEGFAILYSRGWSISWAFVLGRGVMTKQLIPLAHLADGFPTDQYQAELAYAQSFSLVSYIKTELGPNALHRLMRGLSYGLDIETALKQATGQGLKGLERRWQEELKRRFNLISVVTSFFSFWFVATLLFLLSYWLKRRKARRIREAWEQEEDHAKNPPPPGSAGGGLENTSA